MKRAPLSFRAFWLLMIAGCIAFWLFVLGSAVAYGALLLNWLLP